MSKTRSVRETLNAAMMDNTPLVEENIRSFRNHRARGKAKSKFDFVGFVFSDEFDSAMHVSGNVYKDLLAVFGETELEKFGFKPDMFLHGNGLPETNRIGALLWVMMKSKNNLTPDDLPNLINQLRSELMHARPDRDADSLLAERSSVITEAPEDESEDVKKLNAALDNLKDSLTDGDLPETVKNIGNQIYKELESKAVSLPPSTNMRVIQGLTEAAQLTCDAIEKRNEKSIKKLYEKGDEFFRIHPVKSFFRTIGELFKKLGQAITKSKPKPAEKRSIFGNEKVKESSGSEYSSTESPEEHPHRKRKK